MQPSLFPTTWLVPKGAVPEGRPFNPMIEVAVVVTEPYYTADAAGSLVQQRSTETLRFHTAPSGLRMLAKYFTKWADEAETMRAAGDQHEGE